MNPLIDIDEDKNNFQKESAKRKTVKTSKKIFI